MGSEASVASIASITGKAQPVDLSWTRKYNRQRVDEIRLWASPCRIENEDTIEGNKQLLRVLQNFQRKGLITLRDSDVQTLRMSTLPKEQRNGAKLYEHRAYLTVSNHYLKLLAQFKGSQLQVVWDYKFIVPLEDRFGNEDPDFLTKVLKLNDRLIWRDVKKTIEAMEIAKRTRRPEQEFSDTDSWTEEEAEKYRQRILKTGSGSGRNPDPCSSWIIGIVVAILVCFLIWGLVSLSRSQGDPSMKAFQEHNRKSEPRPDSRPESRRKPNFKAVPGDTDESRR